MASFTTSRTVEGPPERVFALFSDIEQVPRHIPEILRVEMLTPKPIGKGTRFRETRRLMGHEATEELEITVFEPPQRYIVEALCHGALFRTEFRFTPAGARTRVDADFTCEPQSLMARMTAPLMMGTLRQCIERDMDALAGAGAGNAAET